MFALASDWGSPFGVFISQSRIRKVSTTCQRDGHPKIGPQVHLGPIKVVLLILIVVVVYCVAWEGSRTCLFLREIGLLYRPVPPYSKTWKQDLQFLNDLL